MNRLDRMLEDMKNKYDGLSAPDTLEEKLRDALKEKKQKGKFPLSRVAAIILVGVVLTYNSSTLAYYGKQLMGYENVMEGTIIQLSRLGQGQLIDKSHGFSDGIKLQLDGVMLDGNGMVVFYTIEDTTKSRNMEDVHVRVLPTVTFMDMDSSGAGEIIQEEHMQKWVFTTDEAPPFFIRTVTLELSYTKEDGSWEYGEIKFKLDRNQAVGDAVRITLDKKVELAGRTMTIEDISMSPISTVVKGEIQDLLSLGMDRARNEYLMPQDLDMSLFADGIEIVRKGSGMSTDMKGSRFDIRFDAVPKETKALKLVLDRIGVIQRFEEEYAIAQGQAIEVLGNSIRIDKIEKIEDRTYITITTELGTRIPGVRLIGDGQYHDLMDTSESTYDKVLEDRVLDTRILEFEGSGEDLRLSVDYIRYTREYGLTVYEESIE